MDLKRRGIGPAFTLSIVIFMLPSLEGTGLESCTSPEDTNAFRNPGNCLRLKRGDGVRIPGIEVTGDDDNDGKDDVLFVDNIELGEMETMDDEWCP
jgi:hypothetical protein